MMIESPKTIQNDADKAIADTAVDEPANEHQSAMDDPADRNEPSTNDTEEHLSSERFTKKKGSKAQRRRHKQAKIASEIAKSLGGNEHQTKPYDSPADWPELSMWRMLQVRLWIARSDWTPEVAELAER